MADSRKKEMGEGEEEGATKDKRTKEENRELEPKRLSYIKFRADIKNQRRKCCIRDAPKIRQKKGRRSHWTLNWFSGSVDIRYHFWHLKFIVVLCKEEEAKGFAPSSIGLPHFLQPSRIFQCRYHQNEPCTLRSLSADSIKGKKVTLKQHAKNMHSMLTLKHKKEILLCCNISLDILLVAVVFLRRWKSGTFHLLVENDPLSLFFSISTFWL